MPVLTTRQREDLFVKLASRPEGVTAPDVYQASVQEGDNMTPEGYQNLARRLSHRGVLVSDHSKSPTAYRLGQSVDGQWLDEEELVSMISEEYPILALPIWRESERQVRDVPEDLWAVLRLKLAHEPARNLFERAIVSYCEDFQSALNLLAEAEMNRADPREIARLREDTRNELLILQGLLRFGLGISCEAVSLPASIEDAVSILISKHADIKASRVPHPVWYDSTQLRRELEACIPDEPFIVLENTPIDVPPQPPLVAAVDGSTRSGVMSYVGEETDFYVGHAPMISINTSIGEVNRRIRQGTESRPVFLRLPEKPEDIQQRDNKYTVMAKLYYPDLSDAEYMHSLWNAMDVLEAKATLRMLSLWSTGQLGTEVPPADVVFRDGTVVPQDRDFSHYRERSRYGEIVRDMISTNWDIVKKCMLDGQTVGGVVKAAQLRVFGPVLNWYVSALAARREAGPLEAWPLAAMNMLSDQMIITRLLTAQRTPSDPWTRTCLVLRPFHATTNFAKRHSIRETPQQKIDWMRDAEIAADARGEFVENLGFWKSQFRGASDPYVQMLSNVWYANSFIATVPRLDFERFLPRIEFIVPAQTLGNSGESVQQAPKHLDRLWRALRETGFEVSAEHSMFRDRSTIEVLPRLVAQVHNTVKTWARELLTRVDEYLAALISQHIGGKRARGIRVRPFTKQEFKMLHESLVSERKRLGGLPTTGSLTQ